TNGRSSAPQLLASGDRKHNATIKTDSGRSFIRNTTVPIDELSDSAIALVGWVSQAQPNAYRLHRES
ncbi:hypothetical protein HC928_24265, partial [bacterium]|nr:hypothetical protein [bacterium]